LSFSVILSVFPYETTQIPLLNPYSKYLPIEKTWSECHSGTLRKRKGEENLTLRMFVLNFV